MVITAVSKTAFPSSSLGVPADQHYTFRLRNIISVPKTACNWYLLNEIKQCYARVNYLV